MKKNLPCINERIWADRLQLINELGINVGIVSKRDALSLAQEAGLDLVLIAEKGEKGVPVAKIMDFGKVLYTKKKKQNEAKKKQKLIKVKELKMRPKIGDHDYQTKVNQAVEFINSGKRVKMTLIFRGREAVGKETVGNELFRKIGESFSEAGLNDLIVEQDSKMGQFWSKIYYLKNTK